MNNIKGGKVIASGGFGCVFSPALKCKNKKREKNKITKLMTEKHALAEYNEVMNIKKKLDKIPNYGDYFLIKDFNLCEPAKLTSEDLINFQKKCTALPKDDITKKNINKSLNKILALNMPNGGIPIDDYVYEDITYQELIKLNNSLIDLLLKGIIKMNENNIYHCDIKDSNILIEGRKDVKTRLIDWGLATQYIPNRDEEFPKTWRNRPFQFNVPFSVVIFTDMFFHKYTKYIEDGGIIDYTNLRPFVIDYIYMWIKERGAGHYKYINNIMFMLFSNDLKNVDDEKTKTRMIESDFTVFYISNYIISVLTNFTNFRKNGTLNLRIYLDTVFIKIVDIWGFISSYISILEILYENYDKLDVNEMILFNTIKRIFIVYLYNPRNEPININKLTKDLKEINNIFYKISNKGKKKKKNNKTLGNKAKGITEKTSIFKNTQKIRSNLKNNSTRRNKYLIFLNKN